MALGIPLISDIILGGVIRFGSQYLNKLSKNDLQREYNWEFLPPTIGLMGSEYIGQYCQEIDFGEYSMSQDNKIQYGSETRGYAGFFDIPKVRLRFIKSNPDVVFTYFDAWKRRIIDYRGFYGVKNDYALTSYVLIEDLSKNVTSVIKMMGTFPTKFPNHSLAYNREGLAMYDVELNVDHIEFL